MKDTRCILYLMLLLGLGLGSTAKAQVSLSVGDLAPGDSVTISYEVKINTPLSAWVTQISQQGTVSGSNFSDVNTDDPETVASNDATVTTLAQDFDFGDAPDPLAAIPGQYPTLLANNGAKHFIPAGGATLYLGSVAPDAESDGQPNATATGDDSSATDDEEGVTLPSNFERNIATTLSVTVTDAGGKLNAWIDWNADGDWADAGEQIFTDQALAAGAHVLNVTPPNSTVGGTSFARFRLSTDSGLAPTGQASDGEVEDYAVTLVANTAPLAVADSYTVAEGGTLTANDANGTNTPGDATDDGVLVNDTDVNGDALTAVQVSGPSQASSFTLNDNGTFTYTHNGSETTSDSFTYKANDGTADGNTVTVSITVTAVNDPVVAANDPLTDVAEDSGVRVIAFTALTGNDSPGTGETGQTLTIIDVDNAVGGSVAINGSNVEFTPTANFFGPASFEYTVQDNGLTGGSPDPLSDIATVSFNITPVGDTPSVTAATTQEGQQTTSGLVISRNAADSTEVTHFQITGIQNGTLYKNNGTTVINNGDFITVAEAADQGGAGLKFTPTAGLYSSSVPPSTFSFNVAAAVDGIGTGLSGTAAATITVNPNLDFGDAPDPVDTTAGEYPSLAANDGARHVVLSTGSTLYLGATPPDTESDAPVDATATGDDTNGADDEDGVTLPSSFVAGINTTVAVTVNGSGASGGFLNAWIDWNQDGDWADAGEHVIVDGAFAVGEVGSAKNFSITVPAFSGTGASFARFRFTTLDFATDTIAATGLAPDGEVEDYEVALEQPATVVGRSVFYKNSSWDGANPAPHPDDDGAIATDKTALLPGGTAAFANYTSYSKGLNGIMVDVQNLANPGAISLADFGFKTGNNNTPSGWASAPAPLALTAANVRQIGGGSGPYRITLIWNDNNLDATADANEAVVKKWLEVTVKATANTGLAADDVFYFGNAVGETGNSATDALVTFIEDELGTRANLTGIPDVAAIDNRFDFDRSKAVDLFDQLTVRANLNGPLDPGLQLIDLSGVDLNSLSASEQQSFAAKFNFQPATLESMRTLLASFDPQSAIPGRVRVLAVTAEQLAIEVVAPQDQTLLLWSAANLSEPDWAPEWRIEPVIQSGSGLSRWFWVMTTTSEAYFFQVRPPGSNDAAAVAR